MQQQRLPPARGNPMTGPFYVEGAEPDDVLAVTIENIVPNRPTGSRRPRSRRGSSNRGSVGNLPPTELVEWSIDRSAGTVSLVSPAAALPELVLPLELMLGCFGVAPPRGKSDLDRVPLASGGEYGLSPVRSGGDGLLSGF